MIPSKGILLGIMIPLLGENKQNIHRKMAPLGPPVGRKGRVLRDILESPILI